jgi:hypothetical protein
LITCFWEVSLNQSPCMPIARSRSFAGKRPKGVKRFIIHELRRQNDGMASGKHQQRMSICSELI